MLQRSITSLFLIFALLFAQAAAVQHQSVHYADLSQSTALESIADGRNADIPSGEKHTGIKLCDQCFNHGELGHALAFSAFKLVYQPAIQHSFTEYHTLVSVEHHLAYPARAPPVFLA